METGGADKSPHIAGIANVASNIRPSFSPKKQVKYTPVHKKPSVQPKMG